MADPTTTTTTTTKGSSAAVRRFPNWTMDRACTHMEWTAPSTTQLSTDRSDLQDADLVVIGVETIVASPPPSGKTKSSSLEAPKLTGFAATIDQGQHGALSELLAEEETQKALATPGGTSTILRLVQPTKRYVLLSLGGNPSLPKKTKKDQDNTNAVDDHSKTNPHGHAVGKALAALCRRTDPKVRVVRVLFPGESTACGLAQSQFLLDLATAFYVELYTDNRYRNSEKVVVKDHVQTVQLTASEGAGTILADTTSALAHAQKLAQGVSLTRDIVNAPHCVLNSESLAETAQRVAAESLDHCITCRILDAAECQARGMGSYLAVARGSETQPQFIHLTYRPSASVTADGGPLRKVGLVGKGVCFDTGGYNIKTQMMELMKFDCGGAAAVLGAARCIGQLQPPGVEAHFIVPACENMISAKAFVPSDVVQASNGITIEIQNTDAEGRLTLADALVYADVEVGCDAILELSTLTGATLVSLGWDVAAMFTDHDALATELAEVSKFTNEKLWRMPIVPEYKEFLKSSIADVNHLGNRNGGAIQAMLFLQHFVNPDKPFAHVDMPGACWNNKLGVATGFGARLITEWITRQGKLEE